MDDLTLGTVGMFFCSAGHNAVWSGSDSKFMIVPDPVVDIPWSCLISFGCNEAGELASHYYDAPLKQGR
jgi:hypothetical protein